MRKLLIVATTLGALVATPGLALAADGGAIVGGTAGAWTGGAIGFFFGGPIGAAIGATTGAAIGASVLSNDDELYISSHPVASINLRGDVRVGGYIDEGIRLHDIRGEDRYGYFRAHGQVYIVDRDSLQVVEIRLG